MMVVPSPTAWAGIRSWEWHRAGVDPGRARTVTACARVAARLEEITRLPPDEATARLRAVPGVGGWTAAEVAQRALGDADALSIGDHHLAGVVGEVLFGRVFDDAAMVAALAPWRPHRYRVVRLLETAGQYSRRRHGPRARFVDHRDR
jgi:3-methyladenine DNA glycosylase/8-oxoguanine DNA glycosylase